MVIKNPIPNKPTPPLAVETVGGDKWELKSDRPKNFSMAVFYRGRHCPICKGYLEQLNASMEKFADSGVSVICISANPRDLAEKTVAEWKVDKLTIGYGLPIEEARKWGLYVSKGIKEEEPEIFFEPGLFLIRPNNTLYAASVQSMPFARPGIEDVLESIAFIIEESYPPCGEA